MAGALEQLTGCFLGLGPLGKLRLNSRMWLGSAATPRGLLCSVVVPSSHVWAAGGKHCLCLALQGTVPICVFIEFLWFPNQFLWYLQHFLGPFIYHVLSAGMTGGGT